MNAFFISPPTKKQKKSKRKKKRGRKLGTKVYFLTHSLLNFSHLNLIKSTAVKGICKFLLVLAFRLKKNVFEKV